MKRDQILILTLLLLLSIFSYGQSTDIRKKKYPGTKELIVKSFNSCCAQKGFKAIYYFDHNGQTIKSSNYFKNKLRASYEYHYNDKGLLIEEIRIFDINDKNRKDTTKYNYTFDTYDRITSKSIKFGKLTITEMFLDFDFSNNPQTTIRLFENDSIITKRKYNSRGQEILKQVVDNDTITWVEESKYNHYGDKIYSNVPTLLDKETGKMAMLIGGSRHAIVEVYKYSYDNLNRWTKKYVVFNNRKVLLEKRIYK